MLDSRAVSSVELTGAEIDVLLEIMAWHNRAAVTCSDGEAYMGAYRKLTHVQSLRLQFSGRLRLVEGEATRLVPIE